MPGRLLLVTSLAFTTLLLGALPAASQTAAAVAARSQRAIDQGQFPEWWDSELPENIARDVERKGRRLAEQLELAEQSKTDKVAELVSQHFARVWAWHQQVDEGLDAAWSAWDTARSNADGKEKDELQALAIMTERIDPIYAEFTPQVQGLLRDLRSEVGEQKAIELMDRYTRSPGAERTYHAYLEMVPEMTDAERAILWDRMAQAREDAMAAWSDGRIIKIFKKYKIRNEFSIDYFGYGYRERYQQWARGGN